MNSFSCYDLISKKRIEFTYQLHRENMPLGPMSVRYIHFSQTALEPNIFDIRDKMALCHFHPNYIALCPPSQTN